LLNLFTIKQIDENKLLIKELSNNLVNITEEFNINTPKQNAFHESGYMVDGTYYTARSEADYNGSFTTLGDILEKDEKNIPDEFFINDEELEKWKYQKGAKSIERVNKTTGHKYTYSEGSMGFPDSLDKAARTIITGEGGASASRFKHVVHINGRYRRLTPVELERANMFPSNHTKGVTASKRAFLMGNALVVGIVEKLAEILSNEL
jgi:DNA (cytosine-5)-methyltransferase 1